ncbi:ABC transporter [Cutibacterium acnes JCM 18909]|nr:ABC transporter [Cutibacterium acnes JCM 18909]
MALPDAPTLLEFRDVTFSYPGASEPVLHDISFTLARGTTTAIIGSTGSGKSTLVNLIPSSSTSLTDRCSSTEPTCAVTTLKPYGAASVWCPSGPTSSVAR